MFVSAAAYATDAFVHCAHFQENQQRQRSMSGGSGRTLEAHTPGKKPIQVQRSATVSNLLNHMQKTGGEPGILQNNRHAVLMERFQLRALDGTLSSRPSGRSVHDKIQDFAPAATQFESHNRSICLQEKSPIGSTIQLWFCEVARLIQQLLNAVLAPFSPFSWVTIARHSISTIALGVYLVWLPFVHAYESCIMFKWVESLDILVVLILLADWLLTFNTAIVDHHGELVTARWEIARQYLKSWCVPDMMPFIMFHRILDLKFQFNACFCVALGVFALTGRIARVCVDTKLPSFLRAMPNEAKTKMASVYYSRYSDLPRIAWILGLSLLVAHYVACIWKILGDAERAARSESCAEDYSLMLFESLQLLLGQGLATETTSQRLFGPIVIIIGSVFLALEFGDVAVLVSNFNANSTEYMSKMERVMAIMDRNNLPLLLQDRILQYYEYLWKEYKSLDGKIMQQLSTELTHTLKAEAVLSKCSKLLMRVPYWKDCSSDFEKQLMLRVKMRVYLPDDFVIRRDEIGDEFYMINRGSCEVVTLSDDSGRQSSGISTSRKTSLRQPRSTVLESGDSFGEMALIMNYLHSADVHSISYVEMCVLSRNDFQDLLVRYPKDRKLVLDSLVTTFTRKNALHQKSCPLLAMVRRLFEDDDMGVEQAAALLLQAMDDESVHDESVRFGFESDFQTRTPLVSPVETASSSTQEASSPVPLAAEDPEMARIVALSRRLDRLEHAQAQMTELLRSITLELIAFSRPPEVSYLV